MTYNVHRCLGVDGRLDVSRIAEVIAADRPDIVALQELDVGRARTQGVDQAHEVAERLGMRSRFHAALTVEGELYGDAILTALPERLVKADALPGLPALPQLEPRGAVWTAVELGGAEVQIVNTHLGLLAREQTGQVDALLGPEWLKAAGEAVILLGDFNSTSGSTPYRRVTERFRDAQKLLAGRSVPTFPAMFPMLRIDHVFVGRAIRVGRIWSSTSPLARTASDHLPLIMEFGVDASRAAASRSR
ncbi:MAG: endonuclease/exonuclease/phosphatase family protein [Proteobacteria bacterium]|nr:endonuclease/exonuclease/phosphatase family protein [Pseudomonadota bacterium]